MVWLCRATQNSKRDALRAVTAANDGAPARWAGAVQSQIESLCPTTKACVSQAAFRPAHAELRAALTLRGAGGGTAGYSVRASVAFFEARFLGCVGSVQTRSPLCPALLHTLKPRADGRQGGIRVRRIIAVGDRQGHEVIAGPSVAVSWRRPGAGVAIPEVPRVKRDIAVGVTCSTTETGTRRRCIPSPRSTPSLWITSFPARNRSSTRPGTG